MTRWSWRLSATNAAPMVNRSTGPSRRTSTRSTLTSAENGTPPKLNRNVPRVPSPPVCGFEEHAAQADVEEANRNRKRQDR